MPLKNKADELFTLGVPKKCTRINLLVVSVTAKGITINFLLVPKNVGNGQLSARYWTPKNVTDN